MYYFSNIVQQKEELKIVLKVCVPAPLSQTINRLQQAILLAAPPSAPPGVAS